MILQHFRSGLQYNIHQVQEEKTKGLLKKFKDHLAKAKLERNYYNKNTKLAEEQRKLVDQIYLQGKTNITVSMLLLIIVMIELKMFMCHIQINR